MLLDACLDLSRHEIEYQHTPFHRRTGHEALVLWQRVLCDRQGGRGQRERVEQLERVGRVDLEGAIDGGGEDAGDLVAAC